MEFVLVEYYLHQSIDRKEWQQTSQITRTVKLLVQSNYSYSLYFSDNAGDIDITIKFSL